MFTAILSRASMAGRPHIAGDYYSTHGSPMITKLGTGIAGWHLCGRRPCPGARRHAPSSQDRLAGHARRCAPPTGCSPRLGLRRWRLAALFLPSIGPAVFMWLVAFSGAPEQGGHGAAREGATLSRAPHQPG